MGKDRPNTEDGKVYDKHGREILTHDIVKVLHFIGARRKKHFMYKQALGVNRIGRDGAIYMNF